MRVHYKLVCALVTGVLALGLASCGAEESSSSSETDNTEEMTAEEEKAATDTLLAQLTKENKQLSAIWAAEAEGEKLAGQFTIQLTDEQIKLIRALKINVFDKLSEEEQEKIKKIRWLLKGQLPSLSKLTTWLEKRSLGEQKSIALLLFPWLKRYASWKGIKLPLAKWKKVVEDAESTDKDTKTSGLQYARKRGALMTGIDCAVVGAVASVIAVAIGAAQLEAGNDVSSLMWQCQNKDFTGTGWLCCYHMCVHTMVESNVKPTCTEEFATQPGDEGVDPDDCGDDYPYHPDKNSQQTK